MLPTSLLLLLLCAHCISYSHHLGSRCVRVSTRQSALFMAEREGEHSSSARTGPKTAARWSGPVAGNDDDDNDNDDEEEEEEEGEFEFDEDAFEDGDDDNDDNDNDVNARSRSSDSIYDPPPPASGFLQWMKTLYEGVFFYGLDEPPADSNSRGAQLKRRALEDMARGKRNTKSTFFTVSEQVAQSLLEQPPAPAPTRRAAAGSRSGDSRRSKSSNSLSAASPSAASPTVAATTSDPEQELALLDAKLTLLSRELQLLDKRVSAEPAMEPAVAAARDRVLREIEEVQIAYVSVKAG